MGSNNNSGCLYLPDLDSFCKFEINLRKDEDMGKDGVNLYSNMDLDKAVSHRIHSGIFEILGYLSFIDKTRMSDEDQKHLFSVKELCNTIITEVHEIINNYRVKEKKVGVFESEEIDNLR